MFCEPDRNYGAACFSIMTHAMPSWYPSCAGRHGARRPLLHRPPGYLLQPHAPRAALHHRSPAKAVSAIGYRTTCADRGVLRAERNASQAPLALVVRSVTPRLLGPRRPFMAESPAADAGGWRISGGRVYCEGGTRCEGGRDAGVLQGCSSASSTSTSSRPSISSSPSRCSAR